MNTDPVVSVPPFASDEAELEALAGMVKRAIDAGTPAKSIAVLARTNATLEGVARLLGAAGVAFQHLGQRRARLEQDEIRGALAYARAALNPADDFAVLRALRCPIRPSLVADPHFDRRLRAGAEGGSLWSAVCRAKAWAGDDELVALGMFEGMVRGLTAAFAEPVGEPTYGAAPWPIAFGALLEFLANAHRALGLESRAESIAWLRGLLVDFTVGKVGGRRSRDRSARGFLWWTQHGQGAGEHDPDADAVTLSTVHLAKGLEWPIVFVPGLVERVFPTSQAVERGDTTEELRTFFVAATRAADRLVLTSCRTISPSWGGLPFPATPSRFLRYAEP